jgi:hypothetical protein
MSRTGPAPAQWPAAPQAPRPQPPALRRPGPAQGRFSHEHHDQHVDAIVGDHVPLARKYQKNVLGSDLRTPRSSRFAHLTTSWSRKLQPRRAADISRTTAATGERHVRRLAMAILIEPSAGICSSALWDSGAGFLIRPVPGGVVRGISPGLRSCLGSPQPRAQRVHNGSVDPRPYGRTVC